MTYENPYIKVVWQDTPESFTAEKINRVKSYFQKKYNTKHVQIITNAISNVEQTKLKSLDISENISDSEYQKILMRDFIKENNIEVNMPLIERLDSRVNEELFKVNGAKIKYNKWYIKKIEFSNFLSFGQDNVIDFTELPGITVIESNPKNFGGKTTASIDLLLFLFFGETTKTKTNAEIFNCFSGMDEVRVKGYVTIDGDDYIIERISTRKKTKKGEYDITNKLEYKKVNDDGSESNEQEEQRKQTEKLITSAIGTKEDFLATILTTGDNLESLIESKPTARGQMLTKFLGLETLRQKEEICKTIQSNWSKTLISNTHNIVDLETGIEGFNTNISTNDSEIVRLGNELSEAEKTLKEHETRKDEVFLKRNNDIDPELIKTNTTQLTKDIEDLKVSKQNAENNAKLVDVKEPSKFYLEEDHQKASKELNDFNLSDRLNSNEITRQSTLISQMEKGDICPTCKRPMDDVDHTEEIKKLKEEVEKLKKIQDANRTKLATLTKKESDFASLKREYDEYERNKLKKTRYELDAQQKQNDIDKAQLKIDNYNRNKAKLDENQKIDAELVILKTQIETDNANIRQYTTSIERLKNNNVSLNEKIKVNEELIKKIKSENETLAIFKVYLSVFGKNGISKVILKNMIPLINQELYTLLVDSCYFILELNVNDRNEVEFIMIDTETRVAKNLTSGSGYEKTISALALRSVFTKISSLPKPNIIMMDEIFKGVADENFELVGEFFQKVKPYFDHIFIISHNSLLRNWSDNLFMVKKDDNVSAIDYINTKIS
jgi:DNA repair exonuclease SbcCD ATPase subunit